MMLDGHVPPLAVAGFAQALAERDLTLWAAAAVGTLTKPTTGNARC
jgi:hypothetical protein